MIEDDEGFRYPVINLDTCVHCGQCRAVCPIKHMPPRHSDDKYVFGGYHRDEAIRETSTSGGAFSAIIESWCDADYVIFGVESVILDSRHSYTENKAELDKFRRSKYVQSRIGNAYKEARHFLRQGKKVLFSGTPCQIAGLYSFLRNTPADNLLTIEVVCEGVPSPLFMRRFDEHVQDKYGAPICALDYRFKDGKRWDFEVMRVHLKGRTFKTDRWFNPFWSIWLQHLMSRPCCYECRFSNTSRCADITLGDLWGVHLYCPELYGSNGGSSLVVCNTKKGKDAFGAAQHLMSGHELRFEDALRYQAPLRQSIPENRRRAEFMKDLLNLNYEQIVRKYSTSPTLKLLFNKYVWGNRQKVFLWNLIRKLFH